MVLWCCVGVCLRQRERGRCSGYHNTQIYTVVEVQDCLLLWVNPSAPCHSAMYCLSDSYAATQTVMGHKETVLVSRSCGVQTALKLSADDLLSLCQNVPRFRFALCKFEGIFTQETNSYRTASFYFAHCAFACVRMIHVLFFTTAMLFTFFEQWGPVALQVQWCKYMVKLQWFID